MYNFKAGKKYYVSEKNFHAFKRAALNNFVSETLINSFHNNKKNLLLSVKDRRNLKFEDNGSGFHWVFSNEAIKYFVEVNEFKQEEMEV